MPEKPDLRQRTYGQWWDSTEEFVTVSLKAVRRVCLAGLEQGGATPEDAAHILDVNLDKAIQGDHARGLGRLPGMVRAAQRGDIDLHPTVQVVRETPATALVDGGPKALAALVCRSGMDLAIQKARQHGIGWVSARASGGILTPYVNQAVDAGMVGMVMVQSFPTVAPTGGREPLLGNGPLAFGIPAGEHDPVIVDMSMTQSSASGVFQAAAQGQQVPEGYVLDERGEPTTDAAAFVDAEAMRRGAMVARGTLAPLGGSHKAYAMIFVISLLSAVLADTSPSWELSTAPSGPDRRWGTLLMALDPSAFLEAREFRQRVDAYIDRVKASARKPGVEEILYPGEGSQRLKRQRKAAGQFAIPASHYHGLVGLAKDLGMEGAL
ncbi:MAG: Ldh family oxidoreductase [Dehalococcoidia bacterium]